MKGDKKKLCQNAGGEKKQYRAQITLLNSLLEKINNFSMRLGGRNPGARSDGRLCSPPLPTLVSNSSFEFVNFLGFVTTDSNKVVYFAQFLKI